MLYFTWRYNTCGIAASGSSEHRYIYSSPLFEIGLYLVFEIGLYLSSQQPDMGDNYSKGTIYLGAASESDVSITC